MLANLVREQQTSQTGKIRKIITSKTDKKNDRRFLKNAMQEYQKGCRKNNMHAQEGQTSTEKNIRAYGSLYIFFYQKRLRGQREPLGQTTRPNLYLVCVEEPGRQKVPSTLNQ